MNVSIRVVHPYQLVQLVSAWQSLAEGMEHQGHAAHSTHVLMVCNVTKHSNGILENNMRILSKVVRTTSEKLSEDSGKLCLCESQMGMVPVQIQNTFTVTFWECLMLPTHTTSFILIGQAS